MKKKVLAVLLILAMSASLISACGKKSPENKKKDTEVSVNVEKDNEGKNEEKTSVSSDANEADKKDEASNDVDISEGIEDVKKDYESILNGIYEYIRDFSSESDYEDEEVGLFEELLYGCEKRNGLDGVGYALKDINADGVDELFIIGIDEYEESEHSAVLSIYTYVGDLPEFVDAGYSRKALYIGKNSEILEYGSQSAAISTVGRYTLPMGSNKLETAEFYFTYAFEEDDYTTRYFKNSAGVIDVDSDEKTEVSEAEFWNFSKESDELIAAIPVTSFRNYKYTGAKDYSDNSVASVTAYWADDTMPEVPDYAAYNASPDSMIMFATDKNVKDFRILSVTAVFTEDSDELSFTAFPEAYLGNLTPERDFAVQLGFMGDMPNYGFSYKDMNGDYRRFLLMISGFDGSVIAEEF